MKQRVRGKDNLHSTTLGNQALELLASFGLIVK